MRASGHFLRPGILFPLFLLVVTTIYTSATFDITSRFTAGGEIGPRTIPLLAAGGMYLALLIVIVQELRSPAEDAEATDEAGILRPLLVVAATAAYIALFRPLGYVLATLLFVSALFAIFAFETRRPLRFVLYVICVTAVFYGLFAGIFGVRLPALPGGLL